MGLRGPQKGAKYKPTLTKEAARDALRQIVLKHMDEMVAAQVHAAKGLTVAVMRRRDGTFRRIESPEDFDKAVESGAKIDVHTLAPSTQAFTDLMNRSLDKPAEQTLAIDLTITETLSTKVDAARKRAAQVARTRRHGRE